MPSKLYKRLSQTQFNVRVNIAESNIFDLTKFKVLKVINSTKNFFSRHPVVIVADPFLFVHNNQLYLFYEEQVDLEGKGIIKMVKTDDLIHWTKPRTVLKEHFHLSYPNVFKIDDEIFMLPETGHNYSIKLYKPNADLTEWNLYKTLLIDRQFVDSSIIYHKNNYYLFTTDYTEKTNILKLYYADDIGGEWVEHPKSPIAAGVDVGRCAGTLFSYKNVLYRPCQRCGTRYGGGVDIYQIQTLTVADYKEDIHKNIIPNTEKFYSLGGHHFNLCKFNGQLLIATDGIEDRLNFLEIVRRLKNKFYN